MLALHVEHLYICEKFSKGNMGLCPAPVSLFGVVFALVYVGWNNRVRTDIFFFERNNDVALQLLMSDNTYPYMGKPVIEKDKIDVYFIVGESTSSDYMSLYGYNKKTTPYLDSLPPEKLSVFKNTLSPAISTFSSYEIMFSRIKKVIMKFFSYHRTCWRS